MSPAIASTLHWLKYSVRYFLLDIGWTTLTLCRKHWAWLLSCLITVLFVIRWTRWNATTAPGSDDYVTASVLQNLSVSILAALTVDILLQWRTIWNVNRTQRHFCTFFGISESSGGVAIVIPKFDISMKHIWEKQMIDWPGFSPSSSNKVYEKIGVNAQPDLVAAANIIAAFSDIGLPTPHIMSDDDAKAALIDPTNSYTLFIAVGLFTNSVVTWLNNQTNLNKRFKMDLVWPKGSSPSVDESEGKLWFANVSDGSLNIDPLVWDPFLYAEDKVDYALVTKVRLSKTLAKKTVFVLGGIETVGTKNIGKYVRDEWRNLMSMQDSGTAKPLDDNEFALLVDVPLDGTKPIGTERQMRVV